MPQLDARRTYQDGMVLFAADLDAIIDDIETLLNVTKLNDDNIQDNGITASQKLVDGTVTTGKLANKSVTTVKIDDDAVTKDKINADIAGSGLSQDSDGSLKVNVDNSSLEINDDTLRVKAGGIVAEMLAGGIPASKFAVIPKLKMQEFLSNGTWTCPQGVNVVLLIGCGGGGGGGAGGVAGGVGIYGAGGAGAPLGIRVVDVTPGQPYNVTIGAGGAAGTLGVNSGHGGDGGSTTFGSYVFRGGGGGRNYNLANFNREVDYRGIPPAGGTYGGGPAFGEYHEAQSSFGYVGGSGTATGDTGGGGGAGPFGPGGNGGNSGGAAGQSAPPNSGAGGGGGYSASDVRGQPGAGGSGRLIVVWVENQ